MRVLILGCGRLTTTLVPDLVGDGVEITVLSRDRECLETVADIPGVEVVLTTEPTMQDYLQMAGVDTTDIFLALSDDDHRNALTAQIARYIFNVPKVICHLDNPQLQILYAGLGLDVVGYSFGLLQDIRQSIEK
jgi:trk system potassium uptake protein TrkA